MKRSEGRSPFSNLLLISPMLSRRWDRLLQISSRSMPASKPSAAPCDNPLSFDVKGDVRPEIVQPFNCTPLFQSFIILGLYLQHMEFLTEITSSQAMSVRTPPSIIKSNVTFLKIIPQPICHNRTNFPFRGFPVLYVLLFYQHPLVFVAFLSYLK